MYTHDTCFLLKISEMKENEHSTFIQSKQKCISHVRQENHPSFLHNNCTLFWIGEVSAVFGDKLKEELLLVFIFGDWGVAVLNQLYATLCHGVEGFIPWRVCRPDWNELFSFQETGSFSSKGLSSLIILKKRVVVALGNSLRDWGICFPSMLSCFVFLMIPPSTYITWIKWSTFLLWSVLFLKRDRGIIWGVKYHMWHLKVVNTVFPKVSVVRNVFSSCSNWRLLDGASVRLGTRNQAW